MKLNEKFMGFKTENEKVGIVLELLKDDTTEREIIDKMEKIYTAPRAKIELDVVGIISCLKKIGAIED